MRTGAESLQTPELRHCEEEDPIWKVSEPKRPKTATEARIKNCKGHSNSWSSKTQLTNATKLRPSIAKQVPAKELPNEEGKLQYTNHLQRTQYSLEQQKHN